MEKFSSSSAKLMIKPFSFAVVILAGGKSSRMKSSVPKQLLKIKGRAAINYLLEEVDKYYETIIIPIPNDNSSKELFKKNEFLYFLILQSWEINLLIDRFNCVYISNISWSFS